MDHETLVENNRKYTLTSWRSQEGWQPITMDPGLGFDTAQSMQELGILVESGLGIQKKLRGVSEELYRCILVCHGKALAFPLVRTPGRPKRSRRLKSMMSFHPPK